jgi:dUTP pyrophosphatase
MEINIINKSQHVLPSYETIASAGMDLRAILLRQPLAPLERAIIKQVFHRIAYMKHKYDHEVLAAKNGITVLNAPELLMPIIAEK